MDKDADAFYQKRVPKGAPDYLETATITFPSGRTADEICPTEIAVPVWCAHMGTLTFHPWPVRRADVDRPDELRIDLDPQPGTTFTRRRAGRRRGARAARGAGHHGYPKTSGNRGVHIYVRIEPRWEFADVRHAAIGFGRELAKRDDGVTMDWWKEERGERIFVDFNQNNRDRTIASAYSLRPIPGAPVSTPMTWEELAGVTDPGEYNLFTVPDRLADGDPWASIDDVHHDITPLLELFEEQGAVELQLPARLPEDARRAAARAAVEEGRRALGRGRQLDRARMSPKAPEAEVRDEASGFAAYLSFYREEIAEAVLALSPAEQRTSRIPSGWTPIELLSHVLHMEQRWFVWGFLGEQVAELWGDWTRDEPWDPDAVGDRAAMAGTRRRHGRVPGRRGCASWASGRRAILAEHDLDEVPPHSPRWDHTDGIPPLRWICFHVLEEYARHAGHLDIAVELANTDSSESRAGTRSTADESVFSAAGPGRRTAGSRRRRRR